MPKKIGVLSVAPDISMSLKNKIYNDNRAMIKNPGRIYTGQQLLIHLMEEKETETEEIEGEVYIIRSRLRRFLSCSTRYCSLCRYCRNYSHCLPLIVLDNTDDNVGIATDAGYDITQPVEGFKFLPVYR